jgi:two-component system response regulator DegU
MKRLTSREIQLMMLISIGQSNKQIAAQQNCAEQTVKNHIYSLMRKMNANNRAHLAYLWGANSKRKEV